MNPDSQRDAGCVPRVHVAPRLAAGMHCVLPAAAGHHLTRVLRLRPGAGVVLFDGRGGEHDAIIATIGRQGVAVEVGVWREVEREASLDVHLVQGISTGERMDFTLQKAVELGVAGIQPVTTKRSVVRLDAVRAEKRRTHWERVCVSACEQCGRNRLPPVHPLQDLDTWLASLSPPDAATAHRLLLSPDGDLSLRDLGLPAGPMLLLAGPEGGLTPAEREHARRRGFRGIRLGPRVLRTETAALAALAAMNALWGDF